MSDTIRTHEVLLSVDDLERIALWGRLVAQQHTDTYALIAERLEVGRTAADAQQADAQPEQVGR